MTHYKYNSIEAIMDEYQAARGWTLSTQLRLMLDFAHRGFGLRAFVEFLNEVVEAEEDTDEIVNYPIKPEEVRDDTQMTLVNIHGGLVQDVFTDGGGGRLLVVDWDTEGVNDQDVRNDARLFYTKDDSGQPIIGRAHCFLLGRGGDGSNWDFLEKEDCMTDAVRAALSDPDFDRFAAKETLNDQETPK